MGQFYVEIWDFLDQLVKLKYLLEYILEKIISFTKEFDSKLFRVQIRIKGTVLIKKRRLLCSEWLVSTRFFYLQFFILKSLGMSCGLHLQSALALALTLALGQDFEVELLCVGYIFLDHCQDAWLYDLHFYGALSFKQ